MLEIHHSRRIFHLLPGLLIIALSYIIPPHPLGTSLLSAVTASFYYMHYRRKDDRDFDIWYLGKFGKLLREEERGEWTAIEETSGTSSKTKTKIYKRKFYPILNGAFYWILGTTLCSALFAPDIARSALLILSVSDPFAAVVGVFFSNNNCNITWGRLWDEITRNGREKKGIVKGPTVIGSLACAFATMLCTYVYFPNSSKDASLPILGIPSRLIVSVSTAIVEAVAGRCMVLPLDDNLVIPVVVGSMLTWLVEL